MKKILVLLATFATSGSIFAAASASANDHPQWFYNPGSSFIERALFVNANDSFHIACRESTHPDKALVELNARVSSEGYVNNIRFELSQETASSSKKCKIFLPTPQNRNDVIAEQQINTAKVKNALSSFGLEPTEFAESWNALDGDILINFAETDKNSTLVQFMCGVFTSYAGQSATVFAQQLPQWQKALDSLDESFDTKQSILKHFLSKNDLQKFKTFVDRTITAVKAQEYTLEKQPMPTGMNSSWFTDVMMFASCGRKFFEGAKNLSREELLAKMKKESLIRPRLVALPNDETIARRTLELACLSELETSLQSLKESLKT